MVPKHPFSATCCPVRTVPLVATLDSLCALTPPPFAEFICLESSSEPAAVTAFETIAAARLPESTRLLDAVVSAPSGERWKVADLTEVQYRLSLAPQHRHVCLLLAADVMDQSAVDMLLKSIGEPPAPTTLLISCPDVSKLAPTLRSRLSASLPVQTELPTHAVERLRALGLPASLQSRPEVFDLLALLLDSPEHLAAALVESLFVEQHPARTAAAYLASFDAALAASNIPANLHPRLRRRAPWLPLVVVECILFEHPTRLLGLDLVPARRNLLSALELSLQPLAHLTSFFVALKGMNLTRSSLLAKS